MSSYLRISYSPEEQQRMDVENIVEDLSKKVVNHGFYSNKMTKQDNELLDILFEYIEDDFERFYVEDEV